MGKPAKNTNVMTRPVGLEVEEKPELIDMETAIITEGTFILKQIVMKGDDLAWRLKIEMNKNLEHTWRDYDIRLSVNEAPFEERMDDIDTTIGRMKADAVLFDDEQREEVNYLEGDKRKIYEELEAMKAKCPTIEFKGSIEELKHKDNNHTNLSIITPFSAIQEVSEVVLLMRHYKIELIRK